MTLFRWKLLCSLSVLAWAHIAGAQVAEEEELALAYGDKAFVTIATGSRQNISKAPAVASVITARDIEAMGATDLDQVLESVPGVHVSVFSSPYLPIYGIRGIHTGYNPQVLMLINGIPINNVFLGDRSRGWGGFPLENVARIEVIRGPGSALYGADAFAGVINVITKTAAEINGLDYGARIGSFRNREAWIQYGGDLGPVQAAFYLRAGKTDGQRETVSADAQSTLDRIFGTRISRAPGPVATARDAVDARMDLAMGLWRVRAGVQHRSIGMGAGLGDSLDPDSRELSRRVYTDLTYDNPNFARDWSLTAQAAYFDIKDLPGDPAFMLFPPGAFGGAFPDGVIGNPGHYERHSQFSLSAFYTGFKDHRIRLGIGHKIEDLYKTVEYKNFRFVVLPGIGPALVPVGALADFSDTADVFLRPHKRTVNYVFAQDEWRLAKDWSLTIGVRQDDYSDFGSTTNPRLALVWDAAYNFIVKAMHGRAFRAPSFAELYNINNPVAFGNPNLRPETIVTNELAFSWQPTSTLQTNLSLFRYRMDDILRFSANADPSTGATAQNTGGQTGRGLEVEVTWDANRNLRLSGHLARQRSIDLATGQDAGLAPHRKLFLHADWRMAPFWSLGTVVTHVGDRRRQPGDSRPQIADYTTVDLTLRREKIAGNWDLRASVLNLFNREAKEPSLAPGSIPYDLPLARRSFYLQLQHKL